MKRGDKVKLINTKTLRGYQIMKQLKKGNIYTIAMVKDTGGLILEEVNHPENMFGETQGIRQELFKVVRKRKGKSNIKTNARRIIKEVYSIITSEEQYDKYCNILERMVFSKNPNKNNKVIELLTNLIEQWDKKHDTFGEMDPIKFVNAFMKEHKLRFNVQREFRKAGYKIVRVKAKKQKASRSRKSNIVKLKK